MKRCSWVNIRCYLPTVVASLLLGVLIVWLTYRMQGGTWQQVRKRHLLNAILTWFVLSPVLIGLVRGWRRQRRHLTQPRIPELGEKFRLREPTAPRTGGGVQRPQVRRGR